MNLPPDLMQQFFDSNGDPLAGGKVYTYAAGTSTLQNTYTDYAGGTPNANPVVLDAYGRCAMWLDPDLSYKFVVKDSSDATVKTIDNVIGLLTVDAVSTESIQDDAVTAAKLADNAVTTDSILDSAVTRAKLATGAVARMSVATKTADYTLTNSDDMILADASGGAITLTLPAAAANSGKVFRFKKTDTTFNAVTIDGNASETIDGSTTAKLVTQDEYLAIACDGSNWEIIDRRYPKVWTSYSMTIGAVTSAPTKGTAARDEARWMRVSDDSIMINYNYRQTVAGSGGTGTYIFQLPTGLTIDTAKISTAATGSYNAQSIVGTSIVSSDAGVNPAHWGIAYVCSSSGVSLAAGSDLAGFSPISSTNHTLVNAGQAYAFTATVPVSGWPG